MIGCYVFACCVTGLMTPLATLVTSRKDRRQSLSTREY